MPAALTILAGPGPEQAEQQMSPRAKILRALDDRRRSNGEYMRPAEITGFESEPARYQKAINTLLQERLINGRKDDEGKLAIAINDDRLADVNRAIRPLVARPMVWLAVLVLLTLGAAGFYMT
jgi:hypothetical protein